MSPLANNIVTQIIFYSFAVMAVLCALGVVFGRNPVRAILCLVLTFLATGAIWIMLQAEFLGLILLIVYVGAVMTLFLFVIMTLDTDEIMKHRSVVRFYPVVLLLAGLILALMIIFLGPWNFDEHHVMIPAINAAESNTKLLGGILYTQYLLPFELAGVMLLLGMVAAIALTHDGRRKKLFSYKQDVSAQVAVKARDRVRLVKDDEAKKGAAS
jgi:NADH-quinone oxidoreductase subunit J